LDEESFSTLIIRVEHVLDESPDRAILSLWVAHNEWVGMRGTQWKLLKYFPPKSSKWDYWRT